MLPTHMAVGSEFYKPPLWRRLRYSLQRRSTHPECVDRDLMYVCAGRTADHWPCYHCRELTCSKRLRIEPRSLRRRMVPCCERCHGRRHHASEGNARLQRTQKDWNEVTVPVHASAIVPGVMAEQFPGAARTAIRTFQHSDVEFATVPDLTPATLEGAIATLGLSDQMYAEQRDHTTVLRRTEQPRR